MREQQLDNRFEGKKIPFEVPSGYFERMHRAVLRQTSVPIAGEASVFVENTLAEHKPQEVFQLEDEYFDLLPTRIRAKIPPNTNFGWLLQWQTQSAYVKLTLASIMIVLVAGYLFLRTSNSANYHPELAIFSNDEIIDYLSNDEMLSVASDELENNAKVNLAGLMAVKDVNQREILQEVELGEVEDLVEDNEK